jgi:type VI secretion system secreted protein VgrG
MMRMSAGGAAPVDGAGLSLHVSGRLFAAPPEVLSFEAEEGFQSLYEVKVRFTLDPRDDLATDRTLLHMPALLVKQSGESARVFHGVVVSLVTEAGTVGHRPIHRMTLRPRAHLLAERRHCRVFQDQTVVQIVTTLLAEHRVVFRTRLVGQSATRAYSVQVHESDWEFVTRLLAEVGIAFFFEHPFSTGDSNETGVGQSEVLVLIDTPQYYPPLEGGAELLARIGSASPGLELPENAVVDFSSEVRPGTNARLVRAYDFQRPQAQLIDAQRLTVKEEPALVYTYGGEGDESAPEYEHARVRLEQDRVHILGGEGRSVCPRLVPGRAITLAGHPHPALDGGYVIEWVRHVGYAAAACPPNTPPYQNRFGAVPAAVLVRPPAPARRPVLVAETGVVVGPPGVEQHVDALGRVRVQFHWDLAGKYDGANACWLRVAQSLAGVGWGAQFLPRVGMEVLVTFLGGDPDRPIVTGATFNATHPWPFPLPAEVTKSGLRTSSTPGGAGFHEISMDDKAGEERLFIHAQRDAERVVRRDDAETVGRDQRVRVGNDRFTEIARRDESVVGERQTNAIGGSETGTSMSAGSFQATTGSATFSLSGGDASLDAAGDISLSAGGTLRLTAPVVTITADVVEVEGSGVVTVRSGGTVTIKGGLVRVDGGTITEN